MDKALSLLGLCRRAGRLEPGFALSAGAARSGKAALLVAAEDISPKTWKNLCYEASRAGIPFVRLETSMERLGQACGIKAGVVAVTDKGFAHALLKQLEPTEQEKEESPYDDKI